MRNWSRSRKGIVAIASGAAGGQIIGLLVTPVISRIYGPEVYGDFALIQSVASVLVPVATLRLPFAILRPKENVTVKTLLVAGLVLTGLLGLVASLFLHFLVRVLAIDSIIATPSGLLWLFLMTFATALFSYLSQAALRMHEYKAVGLRHLTQQGTSGLSQIIFGLVSAGTHLGLSAGRVLGLLASCMPLLRAARTYFRVRGWTSPRKIVKDFWQYPVLFTPSAVLNVMGTQLPILLVSIAYTSDVVGQLGMAQRIALIPSALIGAAVSQVFASEIAAKMRAGGEGIRSQFLSFAGKLGILAAGVGIALFALGPWAIPFILGSEWALAGELSRAMAGGITLGVVASPLSTVFLVTKSAGASILIDTFRVATLIGVHYITVYFQLDAVNTIATLYWALAGTYLLTFLASYRIISKHDPKE